MWSIRRGVLQCFPNRPPEVIVWVDTEIMPLIWEGKQKHSMPYVRQRIIWPRNSGDESFLFGERRQICIGFIYVKFSVVQAEVVKFVSWPSKCDFRAWGGSCTGILEGTADCWLCIWLVFCRKQGDILVNSVIFTDDNFCFSESPQQNLSTFVMVMFCPYGVMLQKCAFLPNRTNSFQVEGFCFFSCLSLGSNQTDHGPPSERKWFTLYFMASCFLWTC